MPEERGESPEGAAPITLSGPERRILEHLRSLGDETAEEEEVVNALAMPSDTVRGSLQRLRSKHLTVVEEENTQERRVTPRGLAAVEGGLPERRFLDLIAEGGGTMPPEKLDPPVMTEEERSAAIGILRRRGFLEEGIPFRVRPDAPGRNAPLPEELGLRMVARGEEGVDDRVFEGLRRRGLVTVVRSTIKRWSASEEGRRLPMPSEDQTLVGALTPRLLASGEWRTAAFRPYDVRAAVPYVRGARPHPYLEWVREFEEILIGLGFEQSEGPLLETEFWNSDVLFMPQEHPARSIHDILSVRSVTGHLPEAGLLERVAAVHEGRALPGDADAITPGWGSPYDPGIAARPVLRSQTTAVSARYLARNPTPPFRMYCLGRNFRRDAVDATHHVEFGQCEGILGEEGVSLRQLVGVFRAVAEALGISELKFRPSYFPFTEPSIEGYARHPRLGWMEVFPGGLFRPEVLRPLGVEVPVAAWGIGITRLAMVALGVSDIRELFIDDLDRLTGGSA